MSPHMGQNRALRGRSAPQWHRDALFCDGVPAWSIHGSEPRNHTGSATIAFNSPTQNTCPPSPPQHPSAPLLPTTDCRSQCAPPPHTHTHTCRNQKPATGRKKRGEKGKKTGLKKQRGAWLLVAGVVGDGTCTGASLISVESSDSSLSVNSVDLKQCWSLVVLALESVGKYTSAS